MKDLYYTILLSAVLSTPAYALTFLSLQLGEPWDSAAASAIAEWNAVSPLLNTDSASVNVLRWSDITPTALTMKEPDRTLVHLNSNRCWKLYDGPQQYGFCDGRLEVLPDLQRVVLHELGHVLGLEHAAEGTDAIMHSQTTDRFTLSPDDEARLLALHRTTTPAQGSSGGGCAMGREKDGALFLLVTAFFSVLILKCWRLVVDKYSRACRRVQ